LLISPGIGSRADISLSSKNLPKNMLSIICSIITMNSEYNKRQNATNDDINKNNMKKYKEAYDTRRRNCEMMNDPCLKAKCLENADRDYQRQRNREVDRWVKARRENWASPGTVSACSKL